MFGFYDAIREIAHFLAWLFSPLQLKADSSVHSGRKCLPRVVCLWSKMPMFQRAGIREGGEPLLLAFQYLILMVWRHFDVNLVVISLLASKCQDFKVEMPIFQPFYCMKLKTSNFKVLAFCSHCRYNDQIQITRSSYHKNQIFKCLWEWLPSFPHSHPLEHRHFTP